jgi:hypothetical protein
MTRMSNISLSGERIAKIAPSEALISNVAQARVVTTASQLTEAVAQKALAHAHDPKKYPVTAGSAEAALAAYLKTLPSALRAKLNDKAKEIIAVEGARATSAINSKSTALELVQKSDLGQPSVLLNPRRVATVRLGERAIGLAARAPAARAEKTEALERPSNGGVRREPTAAADRKFYSAALVVDKVVCKKESSAEPGADEMYIAAVAYPLYNKPGSDVMVEGLKKNMASLGQFRTGKTRTNEVIALQFALDTNPDVVRESFSTFVTLIEKDSDDKLNAVEKIIGALLKLFEDEISEDIEEGIQQAFALLQLFLSAEVFTVASLKTIAVSYYDGFGDDQDTLDISTLQFSEFDANYRVYLRWELTGANA